MDPAPNGLDLQDEEIEKCTNMINSMHKSVQFEGLVALRNLTSSENYPPIQKVLDSGIVPKLLEMATWEDQSEFQTESLWCLFNVFQAGKAQFADYIVELGGLDILMNSFDSKNDEAIYYAITSVGMIAEASSQYRDLCLQKDCLNKLLLDGKTVTLNIIESSTFTIASLCSGQPFPDSTEVLPALSDLHFLISERLSEYALEMALRALAHITANDENIQSVLDKGFVPYLVDCLNETDPKILTPTIIALGNLITGTSIQADVVLGYGKFLPRIFELTTNDAGNIRKEAFWVISNIAIGTFDQIEMILENDEYLERLKIAVATESETVAREAGFAICGILSCGNSHQIYHAIEKYGFLETLTHILTRDDESLKKEALEAILIVLKDEEYPNLEAVKKIEQAGLLGIIQDLMQDSGFEEDAEKILEYFS